MKLRYISLGLDYDYFTKFDNELRYKFFLSTRFISNYISREVRKLKFETSEYNMISISLLPNLKQTVSSLKSFGVLEINLPFDQMRYESVIGTANCEYYLELFELAFIELAKSHKIPLNLLLDVLRRFKAGGCLNEWTHKKKKFRDQNLTVELKCEFDTNCFQLRLIVVLLSTGALLFSGLIARTEPDEVLFEKMFKDILIEKDDILITDSSDSPRFVINKNKIFLGQLEYEIKGRKEIKEILTFGLKI